MTNIFILCWIFIPYARSGFRHLPSNLRLWCCAPSPVYFPGEDKSTGGESPARNVPTPALCSRASVAISSLMSQVSLMAVSLFPCQDAWSYPRPTCGMWRMWGGSKNPASSIQIKFIFNMAMAASSQSSNDNKEDGNTTFDDNEEDDVTTSEDRKEEELRWIIIS